ncbi:MAG TPA: plastocyanin/azurin family copper-binding protein [Solirubrobacterales bacterium]|nr:plastocyanin/azurin family copper-binding protein [Solirubrobacterales bacterium]
MRSLRVLPLALVVVVAAIAAGCGGDDDDDGGTTAAATQETTAAGGGGGAQTVEMTEFEFIPNDPSVKAGDTLTTDNTGSTVHNLTIEEGSDPEQASKELAATPDVAAGDSAELKVNVDRGEYSIVCTIGNHRELGMVGTIQVE